MNHFKVYDTMAFSTFIICETITCIQFQNISVTPKGNSIPISNCSLFPLLQPLATTNLSPMDLPVLDILF